MPSVTDHCNVALSHIGADAVVVSISPPDGSVEAGHCARFYPIVRRELIEAHPWSFTKARATLAEVANPSTIWSYAYSLPSDCINTLRVLPLTDVNAYLLAWDYTQNGEQSVAQMLDEHDSVAFDIEGDVLLTHEPEAVLIYQRDVTDTTKFSPTFGSALGYLLAGYLAGPIIKGLDGARIGAALRKQGFEMMAKAAAADSNGNVERVEVIPGQIKARA